MLPPSTARRAAVALALLAFAAAVHAAAASTRLEYEDWLIEEAASSASSSAGSSVGIASTGSADAAAEGSAGVAGGTSSPFTPLFVREAADQNCIITACGNTCNYPDLYIESVLVCPGSSTSAGLCTWIYDLWDHRRDVFNVDATGKLVKLGTYTVNCRLDTASPCVHHSLGGKGRVGGKHLTLTGSGGIYVQFDVFVTNVDEFVRPAKDAACTRILDYVAAVNLTSCANSTYGCDLGRTQSAGRAMSPPPLPASVQRLAALESAEMTPAGQQANPSPVATAAAGDKPAVNTKGANKAKTAYGFAGNNGPAPGAAPVYKAAAVQILAGTFSVIGQGSQVYSNGYLKSVFERYSVSPVPEVGPVVGNIYTPYSLEYRFFSPGADDTY